MLQLGPSPPLQQNLNARQQLGEINRRHIQRFARLTIKPLQYSGLWRPPLQNKRLTRVIKLSYVNPKVALLS